MPDHCKLSFEIRNIASDDPKVLLDRLFASAGRISAKARERFPKAGIDIEIFNEYPGLDTSSDGTAVSNALSPVPDEPGDQGRLRDGRRAVHIDARRAGRLSAGRAAWNRATSRMNS